MAAPSTANTARPRAWGYQARLNDLYVRLVDIGEGYIIQTENVDERQMRVVESAEDVTQSTGMLFSRSDFSGGEGLAFAHRRENDEKSPTRFWRSRGVDVGLSEAGELASVKLLPKMDQAVALTDPALGLVVNASGTRLFTTDGHLVKNTTNLTSFTDENPKGAGTDQVVALAGLGDEVYAAYAAASIYRRTAAGAWASWSDLNATRLWSAKDRIIAAVGPSLYAAGSLATSTLIYTLPDGAVWNDVSDAGRDFVAAASNGRMYFFTIAADLSIALASQIETPDEVPMCVTAVHDTLFWGTEQKIGDGLIGRWWRATLAPTTSTFTGASVIREWAFDSVFDPLIIGLSTDLGPRSIFATRDSVIIGSGRGNLWRYDLRTGARQEYLRFADAGPARFITQFRGRTVFVANTTVPTVTSGLYAESTSEYLTSGFLIGPMGDLFTAEDKTWVEGMLEVTEYNGGKVELAYATDPDTLQQDVAGWSRLLERNASTSPELATISNVSSRFIAGRLTLTRGSETYTTPEASAFSFRAYPARADLIVQLPVMVSDRLELPGRRRIIARGLGDAIYAHLVTMEDGFVELELFDTGDIFRGRIRQVSHVMEISDKRGRRQTVSIAEFVGRRVTTFGSSSYSPSTLGASTLGVTILGGSETA